MTEPHRDYSSDQTLPVDRDIEIALDSGAPVRPAIDLNDPRARIGLGRALVRRRATLQRYVDEMSVFVRESEQAQAPLVTQIAAIEEAFADYVRDERKVTKEATLTVPGIGVWSSRRANPRWKIDNRLLIEALSADERVLYTEKPEPERKLNRADYIKDVLDPMLLFDDEGAEIGIDGEAPPTGVERIPGDVNVSYDLNV